LKTKHIISAWGKLNQVVGKVEPKISHKNALMQNEMSEHLHLHERIQKYLNPLQTYLTTDA